MTIIRIPTPLRPYTNGLKEITVDGDTVGVLIKEVVSQYPLIQPHLFDESGSLRAYVNIFLNDEDIRHLDGHDTLVRNGDRLMIVPSIAGGSIEDHSPKLVDHASLRINQASIITLLLLAFIFDQPLLMLIVGLVMLIGTIVMKPGFLLIYKALRSTGLVEPDLLPDHSEPHRFAQGFGAVVLFVAFVFTSLWLPILGWLFLWLVIILAGINLFLGFCVGCAMYYWLNRLGVSTFYQEPPGDRIPGTRPPRTQ